MSPNMHSISTPRARRAGFIARRSCAVALLVTAGLIASACSGSSSGGQDVADAPGDAATTTVPAAPSDTSAPSDTGLSDTGPSKEQIVAYLSSPPLIIDPVVNGSVSATATIGASGGELTLDLGDGASATLRVPAGAVDGDVPMTLSEVTAIEQDGASVIGVELSPGGLLFPPEASPILTLSGVPTGHVAWMADSDGVVERPAVVTLADGSLQIGIPHFSTAGGAAPAAVPVPPETFSDGVYAELQPLVAVLARRQAAGESYSDVDRQIDAVLDRIQRQWVEPLLDAAAANCGAKRAVSEAVRLVRTSQLLARDRKLDVARVGAALNHEAECARIDCKNGKETAAGMFAWVLRSKMLLSIDDGSEQAMVRELQTTFQGCMLLRVGMQMRGDITYSGQGVSFSFAEDARADGIVKKNANGSPTVLPMRVTSKGWEEFYARLGSAFILGLATLVGENAPPDSVKCSLQYSGAGAIEVAVSTTPNSDPAGFPIPTVALTPYSPKGAIECNAGGEPDYLPDMGISVQALQSGLVTTPESFKHVFDPASGSRTGSWLYAQTTPFPPLGPGLSGNISVAIRVAMVAEQGAAETPSTSTTGLVNMATRAVQLMAGG